MNNENIIQGNMLIAEFMGYTIAPNRDNPISVYTHENRGFKFLFRINKAKYHTSWNWIMPVVEKISAMPPSVHHLSVVSIYIGAPIETVYAAVLNFITHYNTQNN